MKLQPEEGYFEANFSSWLEACLGVEDLESKKEELRMEAKNLFLSFSPDDEKLPVPAFLEASLAKLIQSMGPGLTGRLRPRICSLSVVAGAVEGCQGSELTIRTASLLSQFFLEQCSPIQDEGEDYGEDYAEQVRDTAVKCLSVLVKCKLQTGGDAQHEMESCVLACSSAKQGVERRCALPLEDEDARHFGGVTGGLSTLPRSRRSNCFDLLQSAVEAMQALFSDSNMAQLAHEAEKDLYKLNSFIGFACICLQGESDPRCLLQLLVLFHKTQLAFEPLFKAGGWTSFPIVAMFDAVAPYYPVNFTPPPNDNHGVTRAGLKQALMSVLSFYSYDKLAASDSQDTMMGLGLGLVLERLIPLDEDQTNLAVNAVEKKDAVDDMERMLFPISATDDNDSVMGQLPKGSIQQISNALIITHQDAAVAVTVGGTDVDDNKKLADACRWLISKIASQLESIKDKSLWNDFVKSPVADMVTTLDSSGTAGRIAIAYLASLVASGGPLTTRLVLDAGLTKANHLLKQYTTDEEVATMGCYGIAAFFSSCRVAMDKAKEEGLHLHPHPVATMGSSTLKMLFKVFQNPETKESYSLRNACVVATESVLVVSPSDEFDEGDQALIGTFVAQLGTDILEATDSSDILENTSRLNLVMESAKALGGLIGKAVQTKNEPDNNSSEAKNDSIVVSKQIQDVLRSKVMVDLLFRSKQGLPSDPRMRFDRLALARASSSGVASATIIVESLLHTLRDALAAHSVSESLDCASACSYVLQNGGDVAACAFHELASPGVTSLDVIDKLCDLDPRRERGKESDQSKTISALDLPPTVEEVITAQKVRQQIVLLLLPAYKSWVPKREIVRSATQVAKILPPLSDQDVVRLSVMLPLLAESLENGNLPSKEEPSAALAALDLANYALNCDYDSRSRSAAGACLHAYIVHLAKDAQECPAKQLLEDVVMPALLEGMKDSADKTSNASVVDCLNLSSVLGSAAASRGGSCVSTADKVAAFLVQVACSGEAEVPFGAKDVAQVDFLAGDNTTNAVFESLAASAFGSMLCSKRPLWAQRLTHKTLKQLEPILKEALDGKTKPSAENLGLIAVLGHLVCTGSLKSANLSKRADVVKILVHSLVSGVLTNDDASRIPFEISEVKRLVVASLLKICHTFPGLLSTYIEQLVIGLMRLYAGPADADPMSDVACKLLVLQVLEKMCHMEIRKKALNTIKPAIIQILGAAMNHPSRLLREAAVTVRNTWATLPQ